MERKKEPGEKLKKRMVHKKYIKRGNKVFGPYLYENYREKGVIKTRYLGKDDSKKKEKLWVNKTFFIVLSIIFIIIISIFILFLLEKNLFETGENLKGELFTEKFLNVLNLLLGIKESLTGELPSEKNVNVFVNIVDNSPPEIGDIENEILVCENKPLSYLFNVSDADGIDEVTVGISDIEPFFVRLKREIDDFYGEYEIFSWGNLIKEDINEKRVDAQGWATYPETITANDGKEVDSAEINITIIEVNNPPKFSIGTKTVDLYTKGDNNVFYYDLGSYLEANFEETPTENLTFNLTFLDGNLFFNISNRGIINVTGNESFILPGQNSTTYWVNISVYDKGLSTIIHPSISLCFPDDNEPRQWSDDFRITVTKENRAPIITSYYPLNLSLFITGSKNLFFNISARDPDRNPVDVYWYVDDVQKEYFEALYENNSSKFEYIFGCGISGNHTVKSVVTDGLLNASVQWNLSIEYVECAKPQPPGGGGGGGVGKLYCEEKWGCNDWMQCEELNKLVEEGWTSKETELLIKDRCKVLNYTEEFCGFQTRICNDFNYCKTEFNKPPFIRECYYTENPTCDDGIKNCHDGSCEVLVDCGGSCVACPTCNDKIQNQGEERVDCGGPCEPCKELPFAPVLFKSIVSYSLIALLILVLILVLKQGWEYYKSKKRAEKRSIKNLIKQEKKTYVYRVLFIIFVVLLLFFANVYITKFTQESVISGVSKIGEGFLASYGFINNLIRSVGIFFISGVLENENSKLQIWDDTDNIDRFTICSQYCIQKEKPSSNLWTVYFYANYTDKITGEPLSSGVCEIRFEDENYNYGAWENMVYNFLSKFFEHSKQFSYKGDYNFEVNCSYNSYSINGEDGFKITNTAPYIIKTAAGYIDLDADGEKEVWQCFEDSVCYYDFSANMSEDDMNDELVFGYLLTGNTTLTGFKINSSSGILEINITHSSYTGNGKKVELSVSDTERTASAILEVNVQDVNDAPIFVNLIDKIFNELDLFEYVIYVTDEENNFPFKFNISFVSCSNLATRGNCTLFDYSADEILGRINISFVPSRADIGNYVINFSVMDNSSLGNKTTSQLVNFSVNRALWKTPLSLEHVLTEDKEFYLNLSENVTAPEINFSFIKKDYFPSFNLASNGIINFTPLDEDVGYHEVEIVASDLQTNSPKTFNFGVLNINDAPSIRPLNVEGAVISLLNITAFENANVKIYLFVQDDDFLIPQKSFYNENLTLNLTVEGINATLFKFVFDSINENEARYIAAFIPRDPDVGNYSITINVTDKSNSSDVLKFNLTIINRNYDTPIINYPNSSAEFNLKENFTSDLIFRANHTIGDNLTYEFYINDELRNSLNYYGDNKNLTWQFTPNFTDETYGEIVNLTLLVLNPLFPELNTSMTWNLTINHTNAPPELIRDIGDISTTYDDTIRKYLDLYFTDIDYYDPHYNQSFIFNITSNASSTNIGWIKGDSEWEIIILPLNQRYTKEVLRVIMSDWNGSEILSSASSNNFTVEFKEPRIVQVPVPSPSSSTTTIPISLKIIMPGSISAYEHEKIVIPLQLVNGGQRSFDDLNLSSSAFKDGNISREVNTSLSKNYFKSLEPGKKENLSLTVFFDTDKIGDYEILVNVTSKSPVYTDWGKIHINLQKLNESQVREILIFTQEFIVKNPQCIEIQEIVKEAEKLFEQGDYENAKIKSKEAVDACQESISQTSVPKKKTQPFGISWSLVFAILFAFVIGMAYYLFKRRKIQSTQIQEIKSRSTLPSTTDKKI